MIIKSAGGGFFGFSKNKSPPQTAENSTPKPETLKDLEKMFPNGIPLSVIKVDLDKADEILKEEEKRFKQYEALPNREPVQGPEEESKEVTSNVPSQPETGKLF